MRWALMLAALLGLTACHQSGTWTDDPGNWQRAMQEPQPKDIVVLHSWYWRSPHFTYEAEYFFEIQNNPDRVKKMFANNQFVEVEQDGQKLKFFNTAPSWFAPEMLDRYDVWTYRQNPGNFRLFIDKKTGAIFISDSQI